MIRDYTIWILLLLVVNLAWAMHRQRSLHADAEALVRVMIPHVSWNPPEEFTIFRLTKEEPELP